MIHQNPDGTFFYECETCWWVSKDYPEEYDAYILSEVHLCEWNQPCNISAK